ncbi:neuropeptide B [Rhynchocyon petersi]
MARSETVAAATLALALLLAAPGRAWYKPAGWPSHYSVGRAAGLLAGFRRSPYSRRAEPAVRESLGPADILLELRPSLRSLALCVQHVAPKLQSCARLPGARTFQCKADVVLSLHPADCQLESGP